MRLPRRIRMFALQSIGKEDAAEPLARSPEPVPVFDSPNFAPGDPFPNSKQPLPASWVMESWPPATIVAALGPDSSLLPAGLHPIRLTLGPPAYIVHALQVQWRRERMSHRTIRPATFEEYLTDLLHRAIDPETVDAIRGDEEFMNAYDFPGERDE